MDISQDDTIKAFKRLGEGAWTVVYEFTDTDERNVAIYCALSDPARREQALGDAGWDLTVTDGGPGFSQSWPDGVETTTYHARGGFDDGIEPLALVREFHGAAESTLELDQQFRLFHNLRYDPASGNYFKMHDDGTETLAVKVEGRKITIRTPLLKQYMAARQLDLLLFVDARAFTKGPVDLPERVEFNDELLTGFRYYGDLRSATEALGAVPTWAGAGVPAGEVWRVQEQEEGDSQKVEYLVLATESAVMLVTPDSVARKGSQPLSPALDFVRAVVRASVTETQGVSI